MNQSEVYLHDIDAITKQIKIENFDMLGNKEWVSVSEDVLKDAKLLLEHSRNIDYPLIVLFDIENKKIIHEIPGDF